MSRFESKLPYVKATEIALGTFYRTIKDQMCTLKRVGYYVSLKESLRKLLEMPEVWQQLDKCHYSQDQFMHGVCDGRYILTDPMFR